MSDELPIACRVEASFTTGIFLPSSGLETARSGDNDRYSAAVAKVRAHPAVESWAANWRPPPDEGFDDEESEAVFNAWEDGLLELWLPDYSALSWPSQVPFMVDHVPVPIGVLDSYSIEFDGDVIRLRGWADQRFMEALAERPFVSPKLRFYGAVLHGDAFGWVTRCEVIELTATANPALDGTSLRAWGPERVPSEEFHTLSPAADRFRAVNDPEARFVRELPDDGRVRLGGFPSSVEVF